MSVPPFEFSYLAPTTCLPCSPPLLTAVLTKFCKAEPYSGDYYIIRLLNILLSLECEDCKILKNVNHRLPNASLTDLGKLVVRYS